jgi:4'-phosphopantetheinyl transferase EntD
VAGDRRLGELTEAAMLAALVPPGVALAATADPDAWYPLPASEAARAAGMPRDRAREFVVGRWCAHRALERLGCPEGAIGSGQHGEPCWPERFTGSIAHKSGAAVAVAIAEPGSIGIDLEDAAALHPAVRSRVLLPGEPDLPPDFPVPAVVAERIVFSAKEAYYKWHTGPHGGTRRPGFADVRVRLHADGRLTAEPATGVPPATGAWVCGARWILTAMWAPSELGPGNRSFHAQGHPDRGGHRLAWVAP